jgi:hypothetical protein
MKRYVFKRLVIFWHWCHFWGAPLERSDTAPRVLRTAYSFPRVEMGRASVEPTEPFGHAKQVAYILIRNRQIELLRWEMASAREARGNSSESVSGINFFSVFLVFNSFSYLFCITRYLYQYLLFTPGRAVRSSIYKTTSSEREMRNRHVRLSKKIASPKKSYKSSDN